MRILMTILACVIVPAWSEAQVTLPSNDAVISLGWASSQNRLGDYDNWRASLFLGASGGHYWTEHLKTEVEAGWHSPANGQTYEQLTINGFQTSAQSAYRIRDARIAVGQSYQFGRNDWVHPYVGAGADIIRRSIAIDRPMQTGYSYNSQPGRPPTTVVIPALQTTESKVMVRPFIKTGAKMYASEKMFFVTELKLGFDRDLADVLWKVGLGFDF